MIGKMSAPLDGVADSIPELFWCGTRIAVGGKRLNVLCLIRIALGEKSVDVLYLM